MNAAAKTILGASLAFAAITHGDEPREAAAGKMEGAAKTEATGRGGRGVIFIGGEDDARTSSVTAERKEELKAVHPHDLVTVRIKDVYSFLNTTKLSTDNKNDTKFSVNKFFNITGGADGSTNVLRPTAGDKPSIDLSSELKRDQTGSGAQKQAIEAIITGHVVEVYPNHTFSFEATQVTENDENKMTMTLFGIARVQDLGADNVLAGERLDGKQFSVKTDGPVARQAKRGWAGKIVDALWPF